MPFGMKAVEAEESAFVKLVRAFPSPMPFGMKAVEAFKFAPLRVLRPSPVTNAFRHEGR